MSNADPLSRACRRVAAMPYAPQHVAENLASVLFLVGLAAELVLLFSRRISSPLPFRNRLGGPATPPPMMTMSALLVCVVWERVAVSESVADGKWLASPPSTSGVAAAPPGSFEKCFLSIGQPEAMEPARRYLK